MILMLMSVVLLAADQAAAPKWVDQVDAAIRKIVDDRHLPGLAVGVVENGKLVYARGFGVQSLEGRVAVTEQSLFHMASVTKPFVATAIMQLVEQGEIDLDAPVVKYLSYFQLDDLRSKDITIHQLLSHCGGLPDVEDYEWDKPQYDDEALERWVRSLAARKMIGAPGEKFAYSNIGFEVLADVIAKVAGTSFEEYMNDHVLEPVGMQHSTLMVKAADPTLLTSPHVSPPPVLASGTFTVSKVFPYNRRHAASSTLYSSIADMSRWVIVTLNRGEIDGNRILNGSTYDRMWTRSNVAGSPVGLSWFLGQRNGHRVVHHGGGDLGFRTNLVLIPDRMVGVIILQNSDAGAGEVVTNVLLDAVLK